MTWNYRVMRRKYPAGEIMYAIYEVFYDHNNEVKSFTKDPVWISGRDMNELKKDLEYYQVAFEKPVLDYNLLEKKHYNKDKV